MQQESTSKHKKNKFIHSFIIFILFIVFIVFILFIIQNKTNFNLSDIQNNKLNTISPQRVLTNGTFNLGELIFEKYNNGIISINNHKYGFAITGKVNGINRIIMSEDYNWTWTEYLGTDKYEDLNSSGDLVNITVDTKVWKAYNNNNKINITLILEDSPLSIGTKMKFNITNNLGVKITETKFWFINTVKEGDTVEYDNNSYSLIRNNNIHKKGNFNNKINQFRYKFYSFGFNDLVENGFNITDIYLGDGSMIGYPNKVISAIGITKGNGIFQQGRTIELDPTITGLNYPTGNGVAGNWFFPARLLNSCDNLRSTNSAGSGTIELGTHGIISSTNLNPDEEIIVNGIEITVEASAGVGCLPTEPIPTATYGLSLSWENGPGYTAEKQVSYYCSSEVAKTFGGLSDDWGRTWTKSELNDSFFLNKLNLVSVANGGKGKVDCLGVQVNYTNIFGNAPTITINNPLNDTTWFDNRSMILNWTVTDIEDNNFINVVYGGKDINRINETILFRNNSAHSVSGIDFIYNWTFQTVDPTSEGLVYLAHLDNNSLFGEKDGGVNPIHDFSPSGFNVTLSPSGINIPVIDDGKFGGAWSFDIVGVDEGFFTIGNGTSFSDVCDNGCTFMYWGKTISPTATTGISRWSASGDNQFFTVDMSGGGGANRTFVFFSSNGTASGDSLCDLTTDLPNDEINDGEWFSRIVTFENGTGNLTDYYNGQVINTVICPFTSIVQGLGGWGDSEGLDVGVSGLGNGWIGEIDEVAIWNRTLSSSEILNLSQLTDGDYYWSVNASEVIDGNSTMSDVNVFTIDTTVVAGDTCTYTSGNWDVDCTDNCEITSNVFIDSGGNITLDGLGIFTLLNGINISGYNQFNVINNCLAQILSPSQLIPG